MGQEIKNSFLVDKKLNASSEDYLKAVYHFSQVSGLIQSVDIADYLGVTRPSVHRAMEILQDAGLIVKPLYGEIVLTEKGRRQARVILCKHNLLKELLISLQVDEETADQDACRMEHVVSDETLFQLLHYFRKDQTHTSDPICPVCWNKNGEHECILAEDVHCKAC